MKLKYLGTAAAEGFPALFCECDTCARAKTLGGKNIRTRSQSIIDERLLIDLCPDTYMHMLHGGPELNSVNAVLITHSHFDHLHAETLRCLSAGMSKRTYKEPLCVYVAQSGYDMIKNACGDIIKKHPDRICVKLLAPFEHYSIEGYSVTALPASHSDVTSPLNFIISNDGKSLFYGHDTGLFKDEIYRYLARNDIHLDLVSLDCTYGVKEKANLDHHLNLVADAEIAEKLKCMGVCDEKTIFAANHFSHNCGSNYDELCNAAKDIGFVISYDGLEIEF